MNSVVPDGSQLVLAENQFNDPPAAGYQFFIANISATYLEGEKESETLLGALSIETVGPSSVAYQDFEASCGLVPDELDTFNEVFEGGTLTGNMCWAVTNADAADLRMFVEESFSFTSEKRVWLRLSP